MNNLDKAINKLLQLMLVDNKPSYLTQLNELYECKKKEETLKLEIEQSINRANSLIYSDYVEAAIYDLIKLQLIECYSPKGYTLDELATKHNLDPKILELVLNQHIKNKEVITHDYLNTDKHIVEKRYVGKFNMSGWTYI